MGKEKFNAEKKRMEAFKKKRKSGQIFSFNLGGGALTFL